MSATCPINPILSLSVLTEVPMAAMNITIKVFWNKTPCSLVNMYRCPRLQDMALLKFLHRTYLVKYDKQFTTSDSYGIPTFVRLEGYTQLLSDAPVAILKKNGALNQKGVNRTRYCHQR